MAKTLNYIDWPPLVLASASPRRKALLQELGADFVIIPSDIEENDIDNLNPAALAEKLAEEKAKQVKTRCKPSQLKRLILAADTVVSYQHHKLGKPIDPKDAFRMLKMLSGAWHEVYTGICLYDADKNKIASDHEMTRVKFRKLSTFEINRYITTGEPLDKAGAYGIQGKGSLLVERIDGCFFNVMGLPLVKLDDLINSFRR